jgi:myo-inositol-1(or 4)-monophosphatase
VSRLQGSAPHGSHGALIELAWTAARAAGRFALEAWASRDEIDFSEKVSAKAAHADLVSVVDRHAEALLVETLLGARPQDRVLGEEGGWASGWSSGDGRAADALTWILDPIDGTLNYRYGRLDWAVSVAAVDANGQRRVGVLYAPARGEAFTASPEASYHHDRNASTRLALHAPEDLAHAVLELGRGGPSALGTLVEQLDGRVRDLRRGGSAALALGDVAAGRADGLVMVDLAPWDLAAGALVVEAAGGQVRSRGRLTLAGTAPLLDALEASLTGSALGCEVPADEA